MYVYVALQFEFLVLRLLLTSCEVSVVNSFSCNIKLFVFDLQCFCCTTPRDVIFAERCSVSVMSTTCVLQHAVVHGVTAVGIRAIALTLGWKPSKGIEPVGIWGNSEEFIKSMMNIHLGIFLSSFSVIILYFDAILTNIYIIVVSSDMAEDWTSGERTLVV